MILTGKYVTLRPLIPDDAALTQAWRTGGRAFLLNRGAQTVEEQARWIASRPFDPAREMNWIQELPDGTPVGMLSLEDIDLTHKRAQPAHFLIGEEAAVKGKPVAFEALSLVYSLAFDTLGLQKLWGPIASQNKKMIRFQEYLGFRPEGYLAMHYHIHDQWMGAMMVALLEPRYRIFTVPKLAALIGAK
jgi:RimJ/RimL family protein N-acetyltransferase